MFDERKAIWIKIYKISVLVATVVIWICGLIWAYDQCLSYEYSKWSGSYEVFDGVQFFIYFLLFTAAAADNYILGMLISNFLRNVQIIREKLESRVPSVETDELPDL